MGIMESLRSWGDTHDQADPADWRVAQGNGWRTSDGEATSTIRNSDDDGDDMEDDLSRITRLANNRPKRRATDRPVSPDVTTTRPVSPAPARLDNTAAAGRVGSIVRDRFIERRPKADRLVYILLRELTQLDPEAGRVGHEWYEANRTELTTQAGSDWILRIRAKIAEAKRTPVAPVEAPRWPTVTELRNATPATPRRDDVWAEFRALAKAILTEVDATDTGARFAVRNADTADNDHGFWAIVNRPAKGSDLPRYYFRQYLGGQGMVRVTMRPDAMITILKRIQDAGPRDAMLLFGELLKKCGDCGRDLTNEESRALRVGPKCRARHAWLG